MALSTLIFIVTMVMTSYFGTKAVIEIKGAFESKLS